MTAERAARVQLRSIKITSVASLSRFIQHIWQTFWHQLQDMLLFFRRREGHAVTSVFNRRGVVVSEAASDPSLALGT